MKGKIAVGILAIILLSYLVEAWQDFSESDYLEGLNRYLCNNVENGGECKDIGNLARGVSAICCRGECRIHAETCRDTEWMNILGVIKTYACINVDNGKDCKLPEELERAGITGTCREGKCHLERSGPSGPPTSGDHKDDTEPGRNTMDNSGQWDNIGGIIFILMVMVLIVALILLGLFSYKKYSDNKIQQKATSNSKNEIKTLQREKEEIEHMIKIAKTKYRQRQIDEESFREIVRDHQKKLIEIETKMDEIEGRVSKLEKDKKTTS